MWLELFVCLLLAHLVSDFVLQSNQICSSKVNKRWRSPYHYGHAAVVFALSWLAAFEVYFWWCALIIGVSHFFIDIWKSYREEKVEWFVVDQLLHLMVIALIAWLWQLQHDWTIPFGISLGFVMAVVAIFVCWKPANIFIKLMLRHFSVRMPGEQESGFKAGALIGTIERWLILVFVCLQRYEALGLLIAAKSIIRFGEKETEKTEYVLAGTLLSILIAVIAGLLLKGVMG